MNMQAPIGTAYDDAVPEAFLDDGEGAALRESLADRILAEMAEQRLSSTAMAARMRTSREALDRLLEPGADVSLLTLQKAAAAVGRRLRLDLV